MVISSDGQFCLSGSWDGTLRLWDINTGSTTRRFIGHTKDVLSVAFSADNRQARRVLEGGYKRRPAAGWGQRLRCTVLAAGAAASISCMQERSESATVEAAAVMPPPPLR